MALDIIADRNALHKTSNKLSSLIKQGTAKNNLAFLIPNGMSEEEFFQQTQSDPLERIFDGFSGVFAKNEALPSSSECAAHLEFLAALHTLKRRVLESDELDEVFDITPNKKRVIRMGEEVDLKDKTMWDRRQVKWDKYVAIAVVRFLAWWEALPKLFEDSTQPSSYTMFLPPIDVLMVWHSFLLNPRWFRRSCDGGIKTLYSIDFPWAKIRIESEDWGFSIPDAASKAFLKETSLEPSLFESLLSWRTYDSETRRILISESRYTLTQSELDVTGLITKLQSNDKALIRYYIDKSEGLEKGLMDAVIRQSVFVGKMGVKLWIRSPGIEGTLRRARERYERLLGLYKFYPTTMFVPTLDIDLAWHTHQCSPSKYFKTTQEVAGKFVNHDDTIEKEALGTGFETTKKLYRIRFGLEYHVCGCWDCEALLNAAENIGKEDNWEEIVKRVGGAIVQSRATEVARRPKRPVVA